MAKFRSIARSLWPYVARIGHRGRIEKAARRGKRNLNLGCQTNIIPGWMNVDIMPFPGATYMDATKPWPIGNGALDAILCEHMIEHVSKQSAKFVLAEAARTLKSGCPLRIVTPNLISFAEMARDPESEKAAIYRTFYRERYGADASNCDVINSIFYGYGHRYIFSPDELREMLLEAGFHSIAENRPGTGVKPVFANKEGHPALLGEEVNAIEAFALEAING